VPHGDRHQNAIATAARNFGRLGPLFGLIRPLAMFAMARDADGLYLPHDKQHVRRESRRAEMAEMSRAATSSQSLGGGNASICAVAAGTCST
jgi:hypothetical protein